MDYSILSTLLFGTRPAPNSCPPDSLILRTILYPVLVAVMAPYVRVHARARLLRKAPRYLLYTFIPCAYST